jgi:hypothetical protein
VCSYSANAQTYTREGNTFTAKASAGRAKAEPIKTKFVWTDSKGVAYPIYMGKTGSCFVIRKSSKTGKEYRSYLGTEVSAEICKELGVKYEPKNKKG